MTGLKHCPFCGGKPQRITITDESEVANIGGDVITCADCDASTRVFFGEKVGIEEAWNTRLPSQPATPTNLMELIRWAHDTLYEINPSNYDHDEVCRLNDASVEVILGLAPVLNETHGNSAEWWASCQTSAPQPAIPDREELVEVIEKAMGADEEWSPEIRQEAREIADALLARGLRLPGGEETMAWAVVGEGGEVVLSSIWAAKEHAEPLSERLGMPVRRVSIRVVDDEADAGKGEAG